MAASLRSSTLETLGLGTVLNLFQNGRLPVNTADLVDAVFGPPGQRGCLVISGINGIVGAGKALQLGSRLLAYDVPIAGLDFPGVPDGLGPKYPGLAQAFGKDRADRILAGIIRFTYDGRRLPMELSNLQPRWLLEAIPEILPVKQAHYRLFRTAFPDLEIRSVTSGFPRSELGVSIAHPAFPHEINKVWEVVEPVPSPITQLLWALGLLPVPVSDHWSFVLDVLFCGLTLAACRYHQATNMPYWKIDKLIRKYYGPNPFRAHDVIGAQGASFLTWSCLHHLSKQYGGLFEPSPDLVEHKNSGQNWYPLNHFRPLVDHPLEDESGFQDWIEGSLFQMAGLLMQERRSHPAHMNAIAELCAQFQPGLPALIRRRGPEAVRKRVRAFQAQVPAAAAGPWYPEVFDSLTDPEYQQLYVNAEHDGRVGVITISRESYNQDVDTELNRALDWLQQASIEQLIVTGDFHLSTQMVGADTAEFFPALSDEQEGFRISGKWSRTARRLHSEFRVSVGCLTGKRCLGGFLELMLHCHYLTAVDSVRLGFPEVTLPVIPGMEGCHWPFRKARQHDWPRIVELLLGGQQVRASETQGWLVDFAGSLEEVLRLTWQIARQDRHPVRKRTLSEAALETTPQVTTSLPAGDQLRETARRAILETITAACRAPLPEALEVQSRHSAAFMASAACRSGTIGKTFQKTMIV